MAAHSSVLAWRVPGTGEPGGLPSVGRTGSDTTEAARSGSKSNGKAYRWSQACSFNFPVCLKIL